MSSIRPTIKDVALAAGVTAGTVSRALRGDPRVIETTRQRILEAADRLEYRPNLQARALQTGHTGAVGLSCPSGPWIMVHPYFAPMHAGFTSAAAKDEVRVTLYMPSGEGKLELETSNLQARELLDGRVDGGLIYQAQILSTETLEGLQKMGISVVLMNNDEEIPGFFQMLSNTEQRLRESLRWAHDLGARRIGVLGLSDGTAFNGVAWRGLESARLPVSVNYQPIRSETGDPTRALDEALDALMAENPEAVIFNSEFHVGRFLQRQEAGALARGPALFSHGGLQSEFHLSFPGVHYVETDLWGAGVQAYQMFKDALQRMPPRSERLVWTRRA